MLSFKRYYYYYLLTLLLLLLLPDRLPGSYEARDASVTHLCRLETVLGNHVCAVTIHCDHPPGSHM